jgi:hypothetical protein
MGVRNYPSVTIISVKSPETIEEEKRTHLPTFQNAPISETRETLPETFIGEGRQNTGLTATLRKSGYPAMRLLGFLDRPNWRASRLLPQDFAQDKPTVLAGPERGKRSLQGITSCLQFRG